MGEHSAEAPKPQVQGGKDVSAAQPTQVAPGGEYTENADGTRNYPNQKPVQTTDEPAKQ